MYFVYILICADQKTYTGCTNNIYNRLNRHSSGYVPTTKQRLPIKLKAYFAFDNKYSAYNFEKYLKTASGRAFMSKRVFGGINN